MIWNEIFSRAGMYLTVLSGSIVALALVSQATDFGDEFRILSLLTLPVVLFVGLGTFLRVSSANDESPKRHWGGRRGQTRWFGTNVHVRKRRRARQRRC